MTVTTKKLACNKCGVSCDSRIPGWRRPEGVYLLGDLCIAPVTAHDEWCSRCKSVRSSEQIPTDREISGRLKRERLELEKQLLEAAKNPDSPNPIEKANLSLIFLASEMRWRAWASSNQFRSGGCMTCGHKTAPLEVLTGSTPGSESYRHVDCGGELHWVDDNDAIRFMLRQNQRMGLIFYAESGEYVSGDHEDAQLIEKLVRLGAR